MSTEILAATLVVIVFLALLAAAAFLPRLVRKVVVHDFEAGLLYRNGRFVRRLAPGAHRIFPWREEVALLDTRRRVDTVAGQEVLSADAVGLKVSVAVDWEIADPVRARHSTQSHEQALHVAVQLALRAAVAGAKIDELLAQRIALGRRLTEAVAPQLDAVGLRVLAVEVKDVMFPGELKKIFTEVVRAQKEGQAALERARAETAALRSLANAGRLVEESPGLMNLRVLQSVAGAAASGGTLVMGVPQGILPLTRKGGAAKPE